MLRIKIKVCISLLIAVTASYLVGCRSANIATKDGNKVKTENRDPWLYAESLTVQEFFSELCDIDYDSIANFAPIDGHFPVNWAKSDAAFLKSKLGSSKKCACYLSTMSSNIPLHDSADEGGYASAILDQLSRGQNISFELYSCPK
jgi:hypothetical protein